MTVTVNTPYVDLELTVSKSQLFGKARFRDLSRVSAIHIHSGLPGNPVLVWLATSTEWENGIAQATPLSNAPCCMIGYENRCSLTTPYPVPDTKTNSYTTFSFCVNLKPCDATTCDWQGAGLLLNIHGYDFGNIVKGCSNGISPGADMIYSVAIPDFY